MSKLLTLSNFSPAVGSSFQVQTQSETSLQLKLIEATKIGDLPTSSGSRTEAFSLLFKGPSEVMLPQQICPLRHADLGELSLFLVPVGCGQDGMRYEAVFN